VADNAPFISGSGSESGSKKPLLGVKLTKADSDPDPEVSSSFEPASEAPTYMFEFSTG
jgi:hypothetical protein